MRYNLGCGNKKLEGWVNVDFTEMDLNKFPYDIPKASAKEILMDNVLEHLDDPIKVLDELHRVSMTLTRITLILPFGTRGFGNPTHKTFWNNYSLHFIEHKERSYYLKNKFTMVEKYTTPYWWAAWIPRKIRDPLAIFTSFLINKEITFVLRVER